MTNTPLTDDIARGNHVVPTEFAQDLERQLMEQCKLLAMSADREEKLRSKILMQAKVYRGEDLKDNSRWSIFNEGRAQALEKLAEETWP